MVKRLENGFNQTNIQIIEDITIEMIARRDELYGFSPKFIPEVFLIHISTKWRNGERSSISQFFEKMSVA
ncbi:MAG: hypothetical protein U9R21_07385 [Candidatus Thermoplasmatota archaeon]|nr:hypothetical protein [Candidatus Thermoplasmatota archaeon]